MPVPATSPVAAPASASFATESPTVNGLLSENRNSLFWKSNAHTLHQIDGNFDKPLREILSEELVFELVSFRIANLENAKPKKKSSIFVAMLGDVEYVIKKKGEKLETRL